MNDERVELIRRGLHGQIHLRSGFLAVHIDELRDDVVRGHLLLPSSFPRQTKRKRMITECGSRGMIEW